MIQISLGLLYSYYTHAVSYRYRYTDILEMIQIFFSDAMCVSDEIMELLNEYSVSYSILVSALLQNEMLTTSLVAAVHKLMGHYERK